MNLIEEIKRRINIVDLAVQLGLEPTRNDQIFSIYKQEKNRSFKLYPKTNSFYCFATGHGGDVIDFYKDYYGIEFKQAVKELSHKAGIQYDRIQEKKIKPTITETEAGRVKSKKTDIKQVTILKSEKEYFDEKAGVLEYMMGNERSKAESLALAEIMNERKELQLCVYESLEKFCFGLDDEAFEYLVGKDRGLKPETIKRFRLFSIKDKKQTVEFLQECFTKDQLLIAGMINKKGNFVFAFHRLIIPYIEKNKITYLRGRTLGDNERISKYISLSNFSGNLTLKRFFNIDILDKIRPAEKLFICEGEFDAMILEQQECNAIGIPGVTNIPDSQINLISNYDLYLAFDNDKAGDTAMHKIANLLNRPIKAIKLKNHNDITELINERNNRADF